MKFQNRLIATVVGASLMGFGFASAVGAAEQGSFGPHGIYGDDVPYIVELGPEGQPARSMQADGPFGPHGVYGDDVPYIVELGPEGQPARSMQADGSFGPHGIYGDDVPYIVQLGAEPDEDVSDMQARRSNGLGR